MRQPTIQPLQILLTLLALSAAGALAVFAHWNLPSTALWYDESVQFWISWGVDPFTAPGTPRGTLRDMVRINGAANLDPGGFSLLLRLWMGAGTDIVWQRGLPFLFFVAGLLALARLGWLWRQSALFALFSGLAPLAYPLILDYATEVRAYSMEFAGIAVGCLLLQQLLTAPGRWTCAWAGLWFGFFLTSRYSYAIYLTALGFILVCNILSRPAGPERLTPSHLAMLLAPVSLSVAAVAVCAFIPQFQIRMTPNDGEMIRYLAGATLAGKTPLELGEMLAWNLFSWPALPLTVGAVAASGITLAWLQHRQGWLLGLDASATSRSFYLLALCTLLLTAALWPWHPWDLRQKWSLYLHALSAVTAIRIAADIAGSVQSRKRAERHPGRLRKLATLATLAAIVGLELKIATYQRPYGNDLAPVLRYFDREVPAAGSVAVNIHWYPTLRYFYEYGPFAGRPYYPSGFRLPYWQAPTPLIGPDTQYLITYQTITQAEKNYPGIQLTADPSLPRNLYRARLLNENEEIQGAPVQAE